VRYTSARMASAADQVRFKVASDQTLLIYFDQPSHTLPANSKDRTAKHSTSRINQIQPQAHECVRKLLRLIEMEPLQGVRNIHPAYASILIQFDALKMGHEELQATLRQYLSRLESIALPKPRAVEIPVCYGGEFGPDLEDVAKIHGLHSSEVIELHSATEYTVYFLGFVPGFAYLGELPESLATPRLPAPRKKVPAGSVGIAARQTGVYPFATPGGWRLLGRTPLAMFRPDREGMSLLAIGDRVRFIPISREQFAALERG
jgi:inhibitor of KinA